MRKLMLIWVTASLTVNLYAQGRPGGGPGNAAAGRTQGGVHGGMARPPAGGGGGAVPRGPVTGNGLGVGPNYGGVVGSPYGPSLPPGLNGLPAGTQQLIPGLNGLPAAVQPASVFNRSHGIYNYPNNRPGYNYGYNRRGGYNRHGYGSSGFVPLFNGYLFPTLDYGSNNAYVDPNQQGMQFDPNTEALNQEIADLRDEVDRLREQAAAPPPQPAAAAKPAEPLPPPTPEPSTIIVLRSGKKLETTNYAVMDNMLWNFSAKPLQKIPLSSIDVAASQRANTERGIDFSSIASISQ
jgi:hypothetical protein